jgi:hypothetical protein
MLMQEAEVRSSAGQHVRSHSSKNVAVFLSCVRPQHGCVRPQESTASLSRFRARTQARCARTQARCARTQARCARTQARAVLARRSANDLEEAAVRSTARTAFDRTVDA